MCMVHSRTECSESVKISISKEESYKKKNRQAKCRRLNSGLKNLDYSTGGRIKP